MAIVSASRRTDIPAFFPEWFLTRIREGFFHRLNPFNARQAKRISLKPADVDAIIFWTKNPQPLLKHLSELDRLGFRYYFQFTLNPYDVHFEPYVPLLDERIDIFRRLSAHVGAQRVIWRYDPIILSNATPLRFHVEHIERIAAALHGATERLMFSFFSFYTKLKGRIRELEQRHDITIHDTSAGNYEQDVFELVRHIGRIATQHGMTAFSCADERDLTAMGILHGSCIDGDLIATLFGLQSGFGRDKHQRGACRCAESIDMGMYDTCSFGCVYCYANRSQKAVEITVAKHDPASASIIGNIEL